MKRSLILIVLIALPALADEQPPVQDSPLVAAAKRAKMAKKTAVVITNKTLKQSGARAHVTTTKKQAPLPKMQNAAPIESSKVADPPKAKPKRQTTPHDDAERLEDDPGRGDLVHCPSCLPILEPVSPTLPLREAELSTNPPKVATPELPQIVPPRPPEAPPLF